MKIIKIVIEKSSDHYSAYAENLDGVFGAGDSIEEVKSSIQDGIESILTYFKPDQIPAELKGEYELTYSYDVQSFLEYYDRILSRAALSRLTGINEKQLGHYIQGVHKPRKANVRKIQDALHQLGNELISVELV